MKKTLFTTEAKYDLFDEIKAELEDESEDDIEITDDRVWNKLYMLEDDYWANFESEYKAYFNTNDFVLLGDLGRWNGRYNVSKIINGGWREFAEMVAQYDSLTITDEDGHLIIDVADHDGSSHFEIKELTQKGWEYINLYSHYDKSEYEDAKTLWNNFYSRLPRLASKIVA